MRNNAKYDVATNFLVDIAPKLSSDLQRSIKSRAIRMIDHTMFIRKDVTGASSTYDLIDEETKKLAGISSVQGTKLNKYEALVFDKISVGYATDASEGKEGAVKYATTDLAALNNANLVISQNGRVVLDLPVSDIIKPAKAGLTNDQLYTSLSGLAYLVDDDPIEMQLLFPRGVNIPSATLFHYLEIKINGVKTIKNQ